MLKDIVYSNAAKEAIWPMLASIMIHPDTGSMVFVSEPASRVFGYAVEEMLGQPVEIVVPESLRESHAGWRKDVGGLPEFRLMGGGRQVYGVKKSGALFLAMVGITQTKEEMEPGKRFPIAVIFDLTGPVLTQTVVLESVAKEKAATLG